jgi:polar amino acid transport system substrate-binding protein
MKDHTMKTAYKIVILVSILMTVGYWFMQRTHTAHPIRDDNTLIVGTNVGYPPFIFTNQSGEPIGFDVDVARAIAQKLNKQLIIKDMAFDALLLALTHGSVDSIIGGISLTQARKKTDLLVPYYGSTLDTVAFFYPKTSTHAGCTLSSAATEGLTVCTQAGSMFEEILTAFPGITIKTLPDIADIVMEVTRGTSDCGLLDTDSVRSLITTSTDLASHDTTIPHDLRIEGFGLGVTPHNPALKEAIRAALQELHDEGIIAAYARHWFTQGV